MKVVVSSTLAIVISAAAGPALAAEGCSIPIEVFEARRFGSAGADRLNEGVCVGVPLPDDLGVKEVNGRPALALEGTEAYQFRTLATWPSGNVRWAAVAFQTDCKAKERAAGFAVGPGSGVSDGTILATEDADTIAVRAGPLSITVPKMGFNLFDGVAIDGKPLIRQDGMGVVVVGQDGKRYLGSADGAAVIEENGPVRCVIRAVGSHRDGDGKRMLGYIVRMVFHRGRSEVRVYYTLTNDEDKENRTKVTIKSLDLVLPLAGRSVVARVPAQGGGASRDGSEPVPVLPDKPLAFYQARPRGDFQLGSGKEEMTWEEHGVRKNDTGYWIKTGDKELTRGSAAECPDLMWMDVADKQGRGCTVGIRFARGNFPKALRASQGGAVSVSLYPVENGIGHLIAHGSHRTFEVLFDFHDKPANDPAGAMYRFQYPLVGRTTVEWYNRCVGDTEVHPLYHFVSRAEEEALRKKLGWTNRQANRRRGMTVWRAWYWGRGGFRNQHDFARTGLVNFLRDDNIERAGDYFLYAEDRINYNVDWSIHHGEGRTDFGRRNYIGRKINFEEEHRHWYGIPLYYYVTGDQRVGDAVVKYVHKRRKDCSGARMYGWARFFGWAMWLLAGGHDLTGDEQFREGIRGHLKTVMSGRRWPMDWRRGVFGEGNKDWPALPSGKPYKHHGPGLMTGYIIHDSFWNARTRFGWDDPTGSRLADICEGIQRFIARECYVQDEKGFYIAYGYNLNGEPLVLSAGYRTPGQTFYALLVPLLTNGEEYETNVVERVVKAAFAHGLREDGYTYLDHPGCQAALYYLIHQKDKREGSAPAQIEDLSVEALGRGALRLTWTTPKRAVKFQARYSPLEMVPNLNYDRVRRTYEFDPARFSNWWAAEHLYGEPIAQPGERQTFVARGLEPGTYVFAIRSWDAANRRSATSNQVRTEVK